MFLTPLSLRHIIWDEISRISTSHIIQVSSLQVFPVLLNVTIIILCILPPNVNVVSCPFKVSFSISPKSQFFLIPYQLSLRFFLHFFFTGSFWLPSHLTVILILCFPSSPVSLKFESKFNGRLSNSKNFSGLLWWTVVKNPPCNAGNTGLIPGPGRSHMPQSN